ncbi:unnamed protein product [Kuraishia capsulata CBS 1993]|uniref:Protein ECM9 n=1 Tax=Kuraishia capsulata CBS 1993 TaxID=1382522 RepID=W6MLA9_9ASCO|nr:uncharacterized protein KUCA_T00003234001 [Kuraishia capsulata CBS 1993]CDK27256.1 unnamed protein product [Kuraishia capsulata CBS 1993]
MNAVSFQLNARNLWDQLTEGSKYNGTKYLQLVPDLEPLKGLIDIKSTDDEPMFIRIDNDDAQRREFFVAKKCCLKLCVAAIFELNRILEMEERNPQMWSESMQWQAFLTTIALLVTSPENHSALNLHQDLAEILFLRDETILRSELYLLISLLTCNNAKVNKSSSIWHLFKKVYLLHVVQNVNVSSIVLHANLLSATEHKNNYYAWSFARFFVQVEWLVYDNNLQGVYTQVRQFCRDAPQDTSSWMFLQHLMTLEFTPKLREKLQLDCLRLLDGFSVGDIRFGEAYGRPFSREEVREIVLETIEWIHRMEITSLSPWEFVKMNIGEDLSTVVDQLKESVSKFEDEHGKIHLINGYFETESSIDESNLLLMKLYTTTANKKRVLRWYEKHGRFNG